METQRKLRDKRNNKIHPYEEMLAQMPYMEEVVEGQELPTLGENKITLAGLQKAELFDRIASMKPEQLADAVSALSKEERATLADMGIPAAVEAVRKNKESTPQQSNGTSNLEPTKKKYRPTAKAEFPIKDYQDKGWTKEQLLAEGYIEEVPETEAK